MFNIGNTRLGKPYLQLQEGKLRTIMQQIGWYSLPKEKNDGTKG